MRRLLVMALLAAGLLGCGTSGKADAGSSSSATAAKAPKKSGFFSVNGTPVLALRPSKPTDRLVLYLHGSGEQAGALLEPQVKPLTDAFLAHGFAVAASNGGSEYNWGNAESVEDSAKLAEYLGYKRIYILAQSMGGIGGIELIDQLHPVAWAGIFPVCNARSIWNLGEEAGEIESAWGPGPPPKSISPAKAKDVKGMPALMFASPEDTNVPIGQNADVCAKWMNEGGAHAKVVETVGEHGDPSNFQPERLANFFARAK
jgi:hypothetical protein